MEIEKSSGFRSSFNFVPNDYVVPGHFLDEIEAEGFETGVHGYTHRGNLFANRKRFPEIARKINEVIKRWHVVGFRAPSMFHNLDWIHALDLEYDASTFDTDPFEPQSDGVGTIFPFIKTDSASGKSYVELPYTLPQDFTLFLLLRHPDIDIWKKKLDWVASRGGMALVIVHPDYIDFEGGSNSLNDYPLKRYTDFLDYVSSSYADQYWHALPREIARYVRSLSARPETKTGGGLVPS